MKKLLPILFVLIITSCSKEVPSDRLVERDGIYYEVNSQTGFTGTSISYYENGQLEEKRNYKSGKENGLKEEFYKNGQIKEKQNYKNGKRDGPWIWFWENGSIFQKGFFIEGKQEGVFELRTDDGSSVEIKTYRNGLRDGLTTNTMMILNRIDDQFEWYSVVNYKDGELHGLVESTHDYSYEKIKNRMYFKEGKLDGTFESFDEDGQLIQRTCYQDGDEVVMSYCD